MSRMWEEDYIMEDPYKFYVKERIMLDDIDKIIALANESRDLDYISKLLFTRAYILRYFNAVNQHFEEEEKKKSALEDH